MLPVALRFGRRTFLGASRLQSGAAAVSAEKVDYVVIGAGPVGASTAWFLAEEENEMAQNGVLLHDPKDRGAHEDWSRLARLSFDGPQDEMDLSRHAVSLLDLLDEVRAMRSGAPVVPTKPGMLFLASPNTPMARACAHGEENYGDAEFIRRHPSELSDLFPGNQFVLPPDTLCWTHPTGLCVSPIELADTARSMASAYGTRLKEGRAAIDVSPDDHEMLRVTVQSGPNAGESYDTRRCFLMAGAQSKQILAQALARDPVGNAPLEVPEFEDTYITAISTVRYKHANHPARPAEGSGHVVQPITLGQLEIPDLIGFQANFSVVAEEYGDVYKTRLSGDVGSEVIETVADMHRPEMAANDGEMASIYQKFFGTLFPHLETDNALDFNRCVTYRNHRSAFSGTSLVEKRIIAPTTVEGKDASTAGSLMTTVGCFGVGVKFGPALGQAAAAHTFGNDLEQGMNVFRSGEIPENDSGEKIERAW